MNKKILSSLLLVSMLSSCNLNIGTNSSSSSSKVSDNLSSSSSSSTNVITSSSSSSDNWVDDWVSSPFVPGEYISSTDVDKEKYPYIDSIGVKRGEAHNAYQILVYSFYDSDGDGYGDLKGVEQKLDYIKGLGSDIIWLSPIMPAESYHAYDVVSFFDIDEKIGTLEIKTSETSQTVDGLTSEVGGISTNLNNNYTSNDELEQILAEQKNTITNEMTTKYQQDMSSFSFDIIKKINEDGVTTLKNTMVTIDDKGVGVAKNNEDVVSLLDNEGLYVSDGPLKEDESNILMKTDRDGAYFKTTNVSGSIKEQNLIQKERMNDEIFGECQGWYWIGGDN